MPTIATVVLISATLVLQADEVADLNRLSWLEGLWMGNKDGIETEELWTPVKGRALLALHRDVKDGRIFSFECSRTA